MHRQLGTTSGALSAVVGLACTSWGGVLPLVEGAALAVASRSICSGSAKTAVGGVRPPNAASSSGRNTPWEVPAGASTTVTQSPRLVTFRQSKPSIVLPSRGLGAGCYAGVAAGVQSRRAGEDPSEAAVPRLTAADLGTLFGKAAQQAMREVNQEREEEVKKQLVWPHVHWSDLQSAGEGDESPSAETRSAEEKTAVRTETCEASTHQDSAPGLWYPRRRPGMLPEHVTFHKRVLPSPAVPFSSPAGKALFADALTAGTAECYFPLSEQFITQAEPAYCGITSLAMVLNTLGIDPRRTWKGRWRWYVEDMLDCCTPLTEVQKNGITFRQMVCLAQCNGADAQVRSYEGISLQEFRDLVVNICQQAEQFLIVSYSRAAFSQSGDGHFSPIGAYHAGTDQLLIMDVARFKYPPHWVPVEKLYTAMSRIDRETGLPRGLMVLSRQKLTDSVLFMLEAEDGAWRVGYDFLRKALPALIAQHIAQAKRAQREAGSCTMAFNLPKVLAPLAAQLPPEVAGSLKLRRPPGCSLGAPHTGCSKHEASTQLLRELHAMPLCKAIKELLPADADLMAERLLIMLILAPKDAWDEVPPQYRAGILDMLNPSSGRWAMNVVATEIEVLQTQMRELQQMDDNGT